MGRNRAVRNSPFVVLIFALVLSQLAITRVARAVRDDSTLVSTATVEGRLAVFDDVYRWHYHPTSDEMFIVVSGCLVIDLADGRELRLKPWQCATIPAGVRHRTRAIGRTENLCFEKLSAQTVFVDGP